MITSAERVELLEGAIIEGDVQRKRAIPAEKPQPFVKWVGGKGRLLPQLRRLMPRNVEKMRHVEPFLGGGAFFFARAPKRALITDINPALINTYKVVRDDVDALIRTLRRFAKSHSEEQYYRVRERYNTSRRLSNTTRAAMFIYLNKTCFNGLHRVNRKGEFNVPMGRYANPTIADDVRLRVASASLREVEIGVAGFERLLKTAKRGDFVYFDPPYVPISATSNFTAYSQDGFGHEQQVQLREVFRALDKRGCKLMLSNSSSEVVSELYAGYSQHTVMAPRAINSNASKRGPVTELVICNYE